MQMRTIFLCVVLVIFIAQAALAQYEAREHFDYPADVSLEGQGEAGNGWAGPWYVGERDPVDIEEFFMVRDENFDYNDEIAYPIANAGNHVIGVSPGDWQYARYMRPLAQVWPNEAGNEYWFSVVVEFEGWQNNEGWGLFSLYYMYDDTLREGPGVGMNWRDEITLGSTVDWGTWPPTPLDHEGATDVFYTDGPQWYVMRFIMSGDEDARAYLWLSPDPAGGEPDTNFADAKNTFNLEHGFEQIAIHFGGADPEDFGKSMKVDEIRLSTSWDMITNVPLKTEIPDAFNLAQNYPNPFNPSTIITYSIMEMDHVTLQVFNVLGQEVATLVDEIVNPGTYEVTFDASGLPSGMYMYRIQTGSHADVKKMMLLK